MLLRRGVLASGSCATAGAGPLLRSAAAKAPEMGLRGEGRASGLSCFGFFHVPRQLLRTWTSSTGSALIQSSLSDARHMLDSSDCVPFQSCPLALANLRLPWLALHQFGHLWSMCIRYSDCMTTLSVLVMAAASSANKDVLGRLCTFAVHMHALSDWSLSSGMQMSVSRLWRGKYARDKCSAVQLCAVRHTVIVHDTHGVQGVLS